MYLTDIVWWAYTASLAALALLLLFFAYKVRKKRLDFREPRWLYVLIGVFLEFNTVTLSPLVPWQGWTFWSKPTPDVSFSIDLRTTRPSCLATACVSG